MTVFLHEDENFQKHGNYTMYVQRMDSTQRSPMLLLCLEYTLPSLILADFCCP